MEMLITLFNQGEPPIYINALISAVVLAIIIERSIVLFMYGRLDTDKLVNLIINQVNSGQLDRAIKYANIDHAVCKVLKAGLVRANSSAMEISMAVDVEMQKVQPTIEKRLGALWPLANIATLIGLIGTIMGLIKAFSGLGAVSADQKSAFLAAGISDALGNTAVGLTIAVTCMIGQLILSALAKRLVHQLEIAAVTLENFLILRSKKISLEQDQSK